MFKKITITLMLLLFISSTLFGCGMFATIPEPAADEITLHIQLNVKEDIGLLVVDYAAAGSDGSGGTSNADKSLLKHDEFIIYTLEKGIFDNPDDVKNLTLRFTVITEYFDPNYDNIYPPDYTKPMDEISFDVSFGEAYAITISGDKTNGYQATLDN